MALQYCGTEANAEAVWWLDAADLLNDETSNNRDLTNNGGVTTMTGQANEAADFGTANSTKYLQVNSNCGYTGSNNFTISFWFTPRADPAAAQQLILLADAGSDTQLDIRYGNEGSNVLRGGRTRNGIVSNWITETVNLVVGTWYHIVLTYNGTSGAINLYRDGVDKGDATQTGTGNDGYTSACSLGASIGGGSYASVGIDELVLSSREWSSTDVTDVRDRVNPPIGCGASVAGYPPTLLFMNVG